MKTTLTVDVHYNPRLTDPEGLAVALDRLLETALSRPGILEEYGNPALGKFFVAPSDAGERTAPRVAPKEVNRSPIAHDYALTIDEPLFRRQRVLLWEVLDAVCRKQPYLTESPDAKNLLHGVVALLDEIADQAHDRFSVDCLLEGAAAAKMHNKACAARCDCERPGYFCCGVPGLVAHLENGRVPPDAAVERCDLCKRYPSDEAARDKLRACGLLDA